MKKCIGCFLSLCMIYIVMNHLYSEKNISNELGQNDVCYIVQFSKSMKIIYSLVFWAGVVITIFFSVIKIKWGGGVTVGHIGFSLSLMLIGLIFIAIAAKWKIQVDGEKIEVYSLGHVKKEIRVTEIENIEEGPDGEITIYGSGKKIVKVEKIMQNYDRLKNTLRQYGK